MTDLTNSKLVFEEEYDNIPENPEEENFQENDSTKHKTLYR